LRIAEAFARAFAVRGVTVVSGMAIGIDAQVHRSTLDGGGLTVAILGCGADVVYPRSHRWLYDRISERGIVASELPPGARPTRWTFPYRNRLLAALGDAVLVVQGSNKSGALQTAKWALELGRPVFSIPGTIMRRESEGCNTLLYEGAVPALDPEVTVEDFLLQTRIERGKRAVPGGDLGANPGHDPELAAGPEDSRQRQVLDAVGRGPMTADRLARLTGLSVREVGAALGGLEAAGRVIRGGPGTYLRASRPP
jgi:DNA processing protein